jgi:hypothetical protein
MTTTFPPTAAPQIEIEFLYLDLTTCGRCVATGAQLDDALGLLERPLADAGARVEVRKILIASAEQARALRFVSSPTIRVNGRDIAGELVESTCEADACSCGERTACRVWRYEGRDYNEAPAPLIVDAMLAELERSEILTPTVSEPHTLPANLERFFARREELSTSSPCCGLHEQAECCEPAAKADCCSDAARTGRCGCR